MTPQFCRRLVALTVAGLACAATQASATIRSVPNQYPTIQAAISAAVAGDLVVVGPGFYTGPGNREIDTLGKAITVKSIGGYGACILDGSGSFRLFYIHSGETATTVINGFTIQHGSTSGQFNKNGGGALISGSSPKIANCLFQNNAADSWGGAIYAENSSLTCASNVFYKNTASVGGAVIVVGSHFGSPVFTGCAFNQNTVTDNGAGLFCFSTNGASVSNCTFFSNSAPNIGGGLVIELDTGACKVAGSFFDLNYASVEGGGAAIIGAKPSISSCGFNDNTAAHNGGGMSIDSDTLVPTVASCTFNGNSATAGGGLCLIAGSTKVSGCTFETNSAVATGGGVSVKSGAPSFANCIITENGAHLGGGAHVESDAATGSAPSFVSCQLDYNHAAAGGGMFVDSGAAYSAPVLTGCILASNVSDNEGGGVFSYGNTKLTGCVLYNNTAATNGAGFYAETGVNILVNCVLTFNQSQLDGGALYIKGKATKGIVTGCSSFGNRGGTASRTSLFSAVSSTLSIYNSILADNYNNLNELGTDNTSTVTISYSDVYGGWAGAGSHNINADPLYSDPWNGNLCPQPGSPCKRTGISTAQNYSNKDILGNSRVSPPDMGAYAF